MGVNQVIKGNEVLLDLTTDTVTPYNLLAGATAHNAAGEVIEGTLVTTEIGSTAISGTTDTSGNIRFSAVSNNKVPLFVAINNLFCTPFVSGTSYYVHIENKSGAVASTAVSGNIYYVQL